MNFPEQLALTSFQFASDGPEFGFEPVQSPASGIVGRDRELALGGISYLDEGKHCALESGNPVAVVAHGSHRYRVGP